MSELESYAKRFQLHWIVKNRYWPFEPGFVMFCYNAMAFLAMESGHIEQTSLQVGQAISIEGLSPGISASISGPGSGDSKLESDSAGVLRYPRTSRVGVYSVKFADEKIEQFAVNLLDEAESNVKPVKEIVLSGLAVKAQTTPPRRANVELWPFLAVLALILVCLEWFVYNSKVRL